MAHDADNVGIFWICPVPDHGHTSPQTAERHATTRAGKFASAKDFADFVQSPAGQKYVMSFADAATSSKSAILNSVRTGVVLLFTGMGFAFANFGNASLLPLRIGIVLGCLGNRLPDLRGNFILAG